ncbi:MAG: hypothetical protein HFJ38_05530 [Bacilli bacterium]|nr:hypothetical protein [Bacilli bacterium]
MLKKIKSFCILFILILVMIFTLLHPSFVFKNILEAIKVFQNNLFPAMFFFYTLSDLLINYHFVEVLEKIFNSLFIKVFHIGGASSFIVIMSVLSGFPSGSKYITHFLEKKIIDRDTANYLLTFTHFSNPLFIMGTISILYGRKLAIVILLSHYVANFVLAFLIRPKEVKIEQHVYKRETSSFSDTLATSFYASFKTLLLILGNTIFFFTVSDILTNFVENPIFKSILYGLFDLTKGVLSVKSLPITLFFQALLLTSFLTFGGLSVHFQVKEIIKKEDIKYFYFLAGRISSLALAILLLICYFAIGII